MSKHTTPASVKDHADAMADIRRSLSPFPPAEQMVIVSGILGDVLCKVGEAPSIETAKLMAGCSMGMVFDMIHLNYPTEE